MNLNQREIITQKDIDKEQKEERQFEFDMTTRRFKIISGCLSLFFTLWLGPYVGKLVPSIFDFPLFVLCSVIGITAIIQIIAGIKDETKEEVLFDIWTYIS